MVYRRQTLSGDDKGGSVTQESMFNEARKTLQALIEAARSGRIVPAQLAGQLEQIDAQLALDEIMRQKAAPVVSHDTQETVEFFRTLIHELRIPMTSIRGYSDMLTNSSMVGELSEMQRQLLDVIRANSRRMESLLTDMSYMNRIRGGMVTVNAKMDMFKNIAMMVEKKAAPLAQELKRTLIFDVPSGLPILNTDAELMSTVLLKLIENGLRYSPEGTGEVTVRASADGHTLVITVSDNGVGMTPEEQAHIGEAFYRSDRDAIRAHKGSGLGLPIAIGLTKALGGTFALESTVNQGTTVTLRFEGMG